MRAFVVLKTTDPKLDHCTLAYFGEVKPRHMRRIRSAYSYFCNAVTAPFTVPTIGFSYFGLDKDVPVLLLRFAPLESYHEVFFKRLVRDHTFGFRPHISVPNFDYQPDTVTFTSAELKTVEREMF